MRQEDSGISSKIVVLRPLAAPDVLEYKLPTDHICIISDDGSQISLNLASQLSARGWQVVVLRYYSQFEDSAVYDEARNIRYGDTPFVMLTGDDEICIQQQLETLITRYGPVAAFIHLHPHFKPEVDKSVAFNAQSESILHQVFLTAKYLQTSITKAAQLFEGATRTCFMTVYQLDGGFGMRGERDIDVVAGGLSGLTKTLALEWPDVFCRTVDISPDLVGDAVPYILAELDDPNRLFVEVGWHETGRVTPEAVTGDKDL